jgi:ATP-dependent exoDNAse (exonuclease V) beta subunit
MQHSVLAEELKLLYVAITRAESNLVIFESDPFKSAPLYYYLRRYAQQQA